MSSSSTDGRAGHTDAPADAPGSPEGLPAASDVVVVGGGIAGACVLHHLARVGVEALLLERGRVGAGTTSAAVGVVIPPMRQTFHAVAHHRGVETARRIWDFAGRSAAGLAEALEELDPENEAEVDLQGGAVLAESGTQEQVRRAFDAMEAAGLPVRWLSAQEAGERTGGRGFTGGYLHEGMGGLAAEPAARILVTAGRDRGARVVEGVGVKAVTREDGTLQVMTDQGPVAAQMVIYANHLGARRFSSLVSDELVPIRGQGLTATVRGLGDQPGGFATHGKMNLWRRSPDGALHLGGWRHDAWDRSYWKTRPEVDEGLQGDLEAWFRWAFPDARLEVTRRWGGIFAWTSDYLPLIGPLPGAPDELVMAGFSGGGLPFAYEGARILAHAVAGLDPVEGAELLNPRRFL